MQADNTPLTCTLYITRLREEACSSVPGLESPLPHSITLIICTCFGVVPPGSYGPRQAERRHGFSALGRIHCEVSYTSFASQERSRQAQVGQTVLSLGNKQLVVQPSDNKQLGVASAYNLLHKLFTATRHAEPAVQNAILM